MKKLLVMLFTAFSLFTQGQNNGATIHVFTPGEQGTVAPPPTRAHKDSMKKTDKNCIKWNWSVLTRGVFLINYEIYISNNLTAEVGVGICYRDFLFEFTKSVGGDSVNQFQPSGGSSQYGSASTNFCWEGGLRYYPGGYDNMEGVFLEANLSYRPYSFTNVSFAPTIGTIVPGYDFLDYQFKVGYVSSHWFSDFVYEFYVGIGIRNLTAKMYETVTIQNSYGNNYDYYKPVTIKETYPQPLLGFKVGYPF